MASFGSGFAAGLNSGMSMGKMLMDTYNENKQKRDLEEAGALDQQVVETGLSDEQKAQVQANREMKLEDGSAAFEVEDTANGVRMRAAGNPDAEWATIAGGKQYKLGNKTQDTEFSKEEISRARSDAIADVYTKNGDPMRGLQYKQAARETRQADNEEKILDFMRNSSNMDDDTFYSGLSKMATNHGNDGLSFGYTKGPNGENMIGMVGQDGKLVLQPATRDLAVSKLLQYVSPKNFQQERAYGLQREELGIKRDTLTETSRHNKAAEGILRDRNGLLGGKGQLGSALGMTDDGKGVVYNTPQGLVVKPLPAGVDGAKLFPKVTGLKPNDAKVKFTDKNGTIFEGTHDELMRANSEYRSQNAPLEMNPPASNQTGRPVANPGKAPAKQTGVSDAELDTMISDASRGGSTGKAYLNEALSSGELTMSQRQRVEKALKSS